MVSLGAMYLNFSNGLLSYVNEAVLPLFLLHQTIILIVGWFVLPWNINNVVKFLIIAVISLALILLVFEVFIRHSGFMRFLFGMTPKRSKTPHPENDYDD